MTTFFEEVSMKGNQRNQGVYMKYAFLLFTLVLSVSAFTANTNKMDPTEKNPPTAKPRSNETTQLDDLVRGEEAAIKAYDEALKDVKDQKQRAKLESIRKDHVTAVSYLSKYVASKEDILEDTESAGAWGTFSKAWVKTRSFTGNTGAVKALSQGEEHGVNEYKEALKDDSLSAELKQEIKTKLLPNQQKHLQELKTLI